MRITRLMLEILNLMDGFFRKTVPKKIIGTRYSSKPLRGGLGPVSYVVERIILMQSEEKIHLDVRKLYPIQPPIRLHTRVPEIQSAFISI